MNLEDDFQHSEVGEQAPKTKAYGDSYPEYEPAAGLPYQRWL